MVYLYCFRFTGCRESNLVGSQAVKTYSATIKCSKYLNTFKTMLLKNGVIAPKVTSWGVQLEHIQAARPQAVFGARCWCSWVGYINEMGALGWKHHSGLTGEGQCVFCKERLLQETLAALPSPGMSDGMLECCVLQLGLLPPAL